ncbi:AMP-binding protein [Micromonospora sp. NPDC000316]|uniref:AMP-binding protein n=1 Tax=Micromonospora sp. NPDC000316 TaxID=3364216 RepID=UPI0036BFDEAB
MMRHRLGQALIDHTDRIAVVQAATGQQTSYSELEQLAAGLDHVLGGYETHVLIILLPKSPLYYAAILRCLVLGLPFCCLDEATPLPRIREVCRQLERPLILGDITSPSEPLSGIPTLSSKVVSPKSLHLNPSGDSEDAHYYIATSGSTGTPKLIRGRQSALAGFVDWAIPFYRVDVDTRWAQFSSTGFDLTLVDIVTVLSAGGRLVALSSRFDRLLPSHAIERFDITHWHSVPSAIPFLVASHGQGITKSPEVFTFCGEPLYREPTAQLRSIYPEARIINTYGPTEGTLFFMAHEVTAEDLEYESMPLGKPIPGWEILLKPGDTYGELECIIISDRIAAGYVEGPGKEFGYCTIEGRQTRTFQTGDILHLKDSKLFFTRRGDRMVKIKGERVDLGEIEAIARLAGASNPVAFKDGEHLHLVFEELNDAPKPARIRATFSEHLPEWLHPSLISSLPSLPRNANGKINRTRISLDLGRYGNGKD